MTRNVSNDASNPNKTTLHDNDRIKIVNSETNPNSYEEILYSVFRTNLEDYFATLGQVAADGWVEETGTWTYVSASSFTISGDQTARYQKGTKLKWSQTSTKYGVVASSSHAAGTTTVTIFVNNDYTLSNAVVDTPYFSYQSAPQGFPDWFAYTPTITGYSANPTDAVYKYKVAGRTVTVVFREKTAGTSNATTKTYTAPVVAATVSDMLWGNSTAFQTDNGSSVANGYMTIPSGSNVITVSPSAGTAWTASGNCRALPAAVLIYEF